MSLVPIHDISSNVSEFINDCGDIGIIAHQSLDNFDSIFRDTLEKLKQPTQKKQYTAKICNKNACGFSFVNRAQEDPEKPLEDLFTDQLAHNKTAQYLTYLYYVYLNNALLKAKIENFQYIFKGGTSYRAALVSLYEKLPKTQVINEFFRRYVLDEKSPDCMFKVSDFDSIVYLLFSGEPVDYLKRAEYVKQNILGSMVRFKDLLENDTIFKNYKKQMFNEITEEWKTPEFRAKLVETLRELYPNETIQDDSQVWVQLWNHSDMVIVENPLDKKYGTVIDLTNPRTPFPRLSSKNYYSVRSPFYVSSNEILKYETFLPSQSAPEDYRFVLNRIKLNIIVHYGEKRQVKAPAQFIDVALPLYNDYGLKRYIVDNHYKHLNALTPYELYRGTSDIDFDADIEDIFRILLGHKEGEINKDRLKVLIYSPYLLFDDLVATLLQKRFPWESKKLEKRIKRFLVMKLLFQLIMKPERPLTNSLRESQKYMKQMKVFFDHGNSSSNEETKRSFYDALERIHTQLVSVVSNIQINTNQRDALQRFFVGGY